MINLKNPEYVKSFCDFEKLLQRNIIVYFFFYTIDTIDFFKNNSKLLDILSMIFDTHSLKIEIVNNQK